MQNIGIQMIIIVRMGGWHMRICVCDYICLPMNGSSISEGRNHRKTFSILSLTLITKVLLLGFRDICVSRGGENSMNREEIDLC